MPKIRLMGRDWRWRKGKKRRTWAHLSCHDQTPMQASCTCVWERCLIRPSNEWKNFSCRNPTSWMDRLKKVSPDISETAVLEKNYVIKMPPIQTPSALIEGETRRIACQGDPGPKARGNGYGRIGGSGSQKGRGREALRAKRGVYAWEMTNPRILNASLSSQWSPLQAALNHALPTEVRYVFPLIPFYRDSCPQGNRNVFRSAINIWQIHGDGIICFIMQFYLTRITIHR